jgi:large subunit ribosomal protein L18
MKRLIKKLQSRLLRRQRIRARISGNEARPRLSVYISNSHVHAQIIDDTKGKTLASSTSAIAAAPKGNLTEKAAWIGTDIAKKAKKAKISKVSLDRNGRKYHGRIKALADAARAEGLEF